jgi:hypothetical protein
MDDDYKRNNFNLEEAGLERMDSHITLNVEAMEMNSDHDDNLDDPDLYFGEVAVDKFWDFYKSDRKFKDFTDEKDSI